jgi:CRISPR-associated protein (TIGR03986 family)
MHRYELICLTDLNRKWKARPLEGNRKPKFLDARCLPTGAKKGDIVEGPDADGSYVHVPQTPQSVPPQLQVNPTNAPMDGGATHGGGQGGQPQGGGAEGFDVQHNSAPANENTDFVPPYNFVRVPNDVQRIPFCEAATHELLQDLCGTITCELTTLTPLFTPDTELARVINLDGKTGANGHCDTEEHKELQLFRVKGQIGLPASGLKGMVRSVFEAVTGSCFGVMDEKKHRETMCWRRVVNLPDRKRARLVRDGDSWSLEPFAKPVRLCEKATEQPSDNNKPKLEDGQRVDVTYAELREFRQPKTDKFHCPVPDAVKVTRPSDGATWNWERIETIDLVVRDAKNAMRRLPDGTYVGETYRLPNTLRNGNRRFHAEVGAAIRVTRIARLQRRYLDRQTNCWRTGSKLYVLELVANETTYRVPVADGTGVVKVAANDRETTKSNERVFVEPVGTRRRVCPEVIADLQLAYPELDLSSEPLVYYQEVRNKEGEPEPRGLRIGPVAMFKETYDHSVWEATPEALRPGQCSARDDGGLCPACRVFGGLFPDADNKSRALAGKVAFNPAWLVEGEQVKVTAVPVPLRILGGPKPSFFPFYLQPDAQGNPVDYNGTPWIENVNRKTGNRTGPRPDDGSFGTRTSRIRGRKFYWHHPNQWQEGADSPAAAYEIEMCHREDACQKHGEQDPGAHGVTNQNVSAELLAPGAKFRFTVDFENLKPEELGVLLWSLQLEDGLAHKFGMGKPIGLGSCKVEVTGLKVRKLDVSYVDLYAEDEESKEPSEYVGNFAENSLVFSDAYEDLKRILKVDALRGEVPDALGVEVPAYWPKQVAANKGFDYYVKNRDQALSPIQKVLDDGWRQRHRG